MNSQRGPVEPALTEDRRSEPSMEGRLIMRFTSHIEFDARAPGVIRPTVDLARKMSCRRWNSQERNCSFCTQVKCRPWTQLARPLAKHKYQT